MLEPAAPWRSLFSCALGEDDAQHSETRLRGRVTEILGVEIDESLFAEMHGHGALDRLEAPVQARCDIGVEFDRHGLLRHGGRTGGDSLRRAAVAGGRADIR
jgi:hypothetical protein